MTQADLPAQDSRAWMERAAIDLRAARALLDAGLASSALFHCQQAAEKSLKGSPRVARNSLPAGA